MKSIQVSYKGTKYRSKLEATTAKFFCEHGIKFIYEPEVFEFRDGTRYTPDFYLPEQQIWVECKGVMTDECEHKIEMLANECKEELVVVINSDGRFSVVESEYEYGWCGKETSLLAHCRNCGKWYFVPEGDLWNCRHCDFYEGNTTFDFCCNGNEGLPDFQFDIWEDAD